MAWHRDEHGGEVLIPETPLWAMEDDENAFSFSLVRSHSSESLWCSSSKRGPAEAEEEAGGRHGLGLTRSSMQ